MPLPTQSVSVVVPVYNSEKSLSELHRRIASTLESLTAAFEVILVNDGSADGSWARIAELAERFPNVRGIDLMRNSGQDNALLVGILEATNDVIVTLDDDLQNPPEEIPKLLETLGDEYDVVYGVWSKRHETLWRAVAARFASRVLRWIMRLEGSPRSTAFRAFRTSLREAFSSYSSRFVAIDPMLGWATTRFGSVEVRSDPRPVGRSTYSFGRLLRVALNMLTSSTTVPLRLASVAGIAVGVFGVGLLAYVLVQAAVSQDTVPGFTFLASAIAIFAGAQLFAIGVIGEYLSRMHERLMGRPYAIVRSKIGFPSS